MMFYFDCCPWLTDYLSISHLGYNTKLVVTRNKSIWLINHKSGCTYTVADLATYKGRNVNDKLFLEVFCNEK